MSSDERPAKQAKLTHDVSAEPIHAPETTDMTSSQHDPAISPLPAQTQEAAAAAAPTLSQQVKAESKTDAEGQPLSKNQLKKLRKKEAWEAGRDWRKAERKRKTKEKKARRRAKNSTNTDDGTNDGISNGDGADHDPENGTANGNANIQSSKGNAKSNARGKGRGPRQLLPLTLLLDCSYDTYMSDKEIMSLGAQITRAYSDNSKARFYTHLVVSSWGGRMRERFEGILRGTYRNWKGIRFEEEGWVGVGREAVRRMRGEKGGKVVGALAEVGGGDGEMRTGMGADVAEDAPAPATSSEPQPDAQGAVAELVYLTSDSPHTLTHLSPYTTYVIGGIVDKNRHKGLCYRVAQDAAKQHSNASSSSTNASNDDTDKDNVRVNVTTAKLPIGEYMQMSTRQVLATNHVVEIMLKWLEYGDWGRAFLEVVPGRKGGKLREDTNAPQDSRARNGSREGDEGEGGEADADADLDTDIGAHADKSEHGSTVQDAAEELGGEIEVDDDAGEDENEDESPSRDEPAGHDLEGADEDLH